MRPLVQHLVCLGLLTGLVSGPSPASAEPLSPEEALRRASARSPELAVALADLEAARAGVRVEALARTPVLTANTQGQYGESFSDTSEGATRNTTERVSADVGVRTSTTAGTQLAAGLSTSARWQTINRDPTTTSGVTLGPTVAAELSLEVTQPLMRGFGEATTLSGLRVARAGERRASLSRSQEASRLALEVLTTYWDLWVAERSVEVERAGAETVARQRDELAARVKLGTSAELDLLRLTSEMAARRQRVVDAEASVIAQQLALARLTGTPLTDAQALSTSAAPSGTPELLDLAALTAQAAASSPELLALDQAIAQARERVAVARDAASTRLDAWANLAAGALWTEGPPSGLALPGGRPAISAMVGLTLELPLGDASNDARVDEALANLRAATLKKQVREETLALEVARVLSSKAAAVAAIASADETAQIARRLADREAARLSLGTGVIVDLVSAQQSLREAELTRLRAQAQSERLTLQLRHLTGALVVAAQETP